MKIIIFNKYFQSLSLSIFGIVLFLSLFLIDSIYATDFNKAQTSKSGIVDMMEVLPEYLQVDSTAENRDFHIKRNERSIGSGTQYYFYMEGGTLTVSMTTDGIFRIGNSIIGTSTAGNASYPINLVGGTETTGVLPESQGGFGTSTPKYVRQNDGSSTTQLATNITIAGVGTDTATMNTSGVDISPTEKSYLDGLTSNIQTQVNTLGTSTPTANSIVRTETGTTTIGSGWIPNTITLNNLTQITTRNYDDVTGTSTIKPTQIAIGTTTLQGALNAVGSATFSGTVTATGFVGDGSQLTGISSGSVAFSEVTGEPTNNASLVTWGHNMVITGLSGGTTTVGKALYFSANDTLAVATWTGTETAAIGFANGSTGQIIIAGKVSGLTGLTANRWYVLAGNGDISLTGTTTTNYIAQTVLYSTGTSTGIINITPSAINSL